MTENKIFIYQILPRLFTNTNSNNIKGGTIDENGSGKFEDISTSFLKKIKKQGYTHLWLIGVLAHASATDYTEYGIPQEYPEIIKGKAGSPYAVRDYYDVDPDLAVDVSNRLEEYEALISRIHKEGMKIIMDFIPNHLARNYYSISKPNEISDFGENDNINLHFAPNNNFYYLPGQNLELNFIDKNNQKYSYVESPAKATGNDSFTNSPSVYDWYETVKLNYGVDYIGGCAAYFDPVPDTWVKMRDILLFWSGKDVDGFRCDMAEMVPLAFWEWMIPQLKDKYPSLIFIAEIYNPSLYRPFLRDNIFDYLYDKVGLYDTLRDVSCGNKASSDISFVLNEVGDIQKRMLNFIENHDEQRVASDFFLGDGNKAKPAMIVSTCINTNPVMVYFGQELGEQGMDEEGFSGLDGKTTIFDYWSVDTVKRWNNNGKWNDDLLTKPEKDLKKFYAKLIRLCNNEVALSHGLFYDLMSANYDNDEFDSTKQFAFLRGTKDDVVLVVVNFDNSPVDITIDIPLHAYEFFGLSSKNEISVKSLLLGSRKKNTISKTNRLKLRIEEYSGDVYKVLSL